MNSREVVITAENGTWRGDLSVPAEPVGAVLFAHGSGSSRFSVRNRLVAERFQDAGLATLLLDLLDDEEAAERGKSFDIELLADRLQRGASWLQQYLALPLGLFGASTGAAAAMILAARSPERVQAMVSRGGRIDLAYDDLPQIQAPTLLIVGGADFEVLTAHRKAVPQLACPNELRVIRGATHLFEEPGALEEVAKMAAGWFRFHLQSALERTSFRDPQSS